MTTTMQTTVPLRNAMPKGLSIIQSKTMDHSKGPIGPTAPNKLINEIINDAATVSSATTTDDESSPDHQNGYSFNFKRAGLVGRETEKRVISNALKQLLRPRAVSLLDDTYSNSDSTIGSSRRIASANDSDTIGRTSTKGRLKTMCLISGQSGTGKSALALHHKPLCLDNFAFFVCGKFDLQQMEEPYSGIKTAMCQLIEQIKELPQNDIVGASVKDPRRLSKLRRALIREISTNELTTLCKIIPSLSEIMTGRSAEDIGITTSKFDSHQPHGDGHLLAKQPSFASLSSTLSSVADASTQDSGAPLSGTTEGYREKSDRITNTLKRFLQIICKHSPLVLMVDDIQWADKASLNLMQAWMLDGNIKSLMIIGCYRSNQLQQSAGLQAMIANIRACKRERAIRILDIGMEDLPLPSIRELLVEVLLPDNDKDVDSLADIVHRRTGGNIFFVKQFMESLVDQKLLCFDVDGGLKWIWNEEQIMAESSATDNIVDLMKQKLQRLDAARHVLPVAACLGACFSKKKLILVIRAMSIHSDHRGFFGNLLLDEDDSLLSKSLHRTSDHSLSRHQLQADATTNAGICSSLDVCEKEGLIQRSLPHATKRRASQTQKMKMKNPANTKANAKHSERYTFVHDKVQEAALSLVPQDKLSELQHRVGDVLLSSYSKGDMGEHEVFMFAGLINSRLDLVPANAQQPDRRRRIVMLNYKAGQLAVESAAFQSAIGYFRTAIQLLPEDHWKLNFHLSLDIYSSAAECAYINADSDGLKKYCSAILDLDCSILHKIRAYHIFIDALFTESQEARINETKPVLLHVLSELGCTFPKGKMARTVRVLRGLSKAKRMAAKWTSLESIQSNRHARRSSASASSSLSSSARISADPNQMAIVKTLSKFSIIAYIACPEMLPLIVLECVERTMKHGIMPYSSIAFAQLSLLVGYFMGDFVVAEQIAKIALQMAEIPSNHNCRGKVVFLVHLCTLHWLHPVQDSLSHFLRAHDLAMTYGDVDTALRSAVNFAQTSFVWGKPLARLDEDMLKYSNILKDYRQLDQIQFLSASWQAVQNLRGLSRHDTKLTGDALDEDAAIQRAIEEGDSFFHFAILGYKQFVAAFLGDYELAASLSIQTFSIKLKKYPGLNVLPATALHGGMSCYAAAHTIKQRKMTAKARLHLKHGNKCLKQLRQWKEKGNPNCLHAVAFLEGESKMSRAKYASALCKFKDAIELAKSHGFSHDQALANERFSECFSRMGRHDAALLALDESIRLYKKWGATRKVEKLRVRLREMAK